MSISNFLENAILDKVFRNVDFTCTSVYVSLHTGDPGETGANELAAGTSSYARQTGTFNLATSGAVDNSAIVLFTNLPDGTLTHGGLWDAVSGTNFLWGGTLVSTKVVTAGDSFQVNANDLDITLD